MFENGFFKKVFRRLFGPESITSTLIHLLGANKARYLPDVLAMKKPRVFTETRLPWCDGTYIDWKKVY